MKEDVTRMERISKAAQLLADKDIDTMEDLLRRGMSPADMMILVRTKDEAALITDLKTQLDPNTYPLLSAARIVSADSFLLDASEAVKTIIAGLQVVVRDDAVAEKYIEMTTRRPEAAALIHQRITPKTPLYEAVCELVRILLADEDGQYNGSEIAYVNNLLDRTRDYVTAYGSHIEDFLIYWEDTLHGKAIPASATDAIRILTVHASKGLQSQTLFIPFCMWTKEAGKHPQKIWCEVAPELNAGKDYVPIQDGAEMEQSAYHTEYAAEHLNMLYVALTRAEDNLYISTAYPVTSKGEMGTCNHVGRYLMDWLETDEYEIGTPVVVKKEAKADAVAEELQSELLCHEIFAHLRKADELDAVLDTFQTRGEIKSDEERQELYELISAAWKGSPEMKDWFTSPWVLKLEEAIYIDHRELRPDRVMINPETNEAIVLDYKFGGWEDKYIQQVGEYMEALRRMGYNPVRGYLWFARKNQLKQVHG